MAAQIGCGGPPSLSDASAATFPALGATVSVAWQTSDVQELDLLVVVDDTAARPPSRPHFRRSWRSWRTFWPRRPDGQPPLHVAFIPGTVGGAGCTPPQNRAAACGVAAGDDFLTSEYCGVQPNFSGPTVRRVRVPGQLRRRPTAGPSSRSRPRTARSADAAQGGLKGAVAFLDARGEARRCSIVADAGRRLAEPVADYLRNSTAAAAGLLPPCWSRHTTVRPTGPSRRTDVPRLTRFASGGPASSTSLCDSSFISALTAAETRSGVLQLPPSLVGRQGRRTPRRPGLQAELRRDRRCHRGGWHPRHHAAAQRATPPRR